MDHDGLDHYIRQTQSRFVANYHGQYLVSDGFYMVMVHKDSDLLISHGLTYPQGHGEVFRWHEGRRVGVTRNPVDIWDAAMAIRAEMQELKHTNWFHQHPYDDECHRRLMIHPDGTQMLLDAGRLSAMTYASAYRCFGRTNDDPVIICNLVPQEVDVVGILRPLPVDFVDADPPQVIRALSMID